MYIRSSIGHTIRNDIKDEDLEFLCVQISKPKVKPFLVSTWYRPPNSSIHLFEKFQDKILFETRLNLWELKTT